MKFNKTLKILGFLKGTGPLELEHSYVGDGYCDDELNNSDCGYDGGDCCLVEINTDYCLVCECLN